MKHQHHLWKIEDCYTNKCNESRAMLHTHSSQLMLTARAGHEPGACSFWAVKGHIAPQVTLSPRGLQKD